MSSHIEQRPPNYPAGPTLDTSQANVNLGNGDAGLFQARVPFNDTTAATARPINQHAATCCEVMGSWRSMFIPRVLQRDDGRLYMEFGLALAVSFAAQSGDFVSILGWSLFTPEARGRGGNGRLVSLAATAAQGLGGRCS